jgi:hypothetical protein
MLSSLPYTVKRAKSIIALTGLLVCAAATFFTAAIAAAEELHLSQKQLAEIGIRVWRNECSGSVSGLTSWNVGEEFPSLGIGHFIWYPAGVRGPFDESFPRVLRFLQEHGVKLPEWLSPDMPAPWSSREEFLKELNGSRISELRKLLADTVALQTQFIVERLENALPKMLEKADPADREKVQREFYRVLHSGAAGTFALIDYVNFKGEGVLDTERYNGKGWGLLQVLANMKDTRNPVQDFADSAKAMLKQRVENSPPARHESRWLPGWLKRVDAYVR